MHKEATAVYLRHLRKTSDVVGRSVGGDLQRCIISFFQCGHTLALVNSLPLCHYEVTAITTVFYPAFGKKEQ